MEAGIYKRGYAWRGDQVTQVDTCPLKATTPLEQAYAYDGQTRLTSATRPPGNFAAAKPENVRMLHEGSLQLPLITPGESQ